MLRDPRAKHVPYTFATEDKQSLITPPSFRHGLPESSSQGGEKTSDD